MTTLTYIGKAALTLSAFANDALTVTVDRPSTLTRNYASALLGITAISNFVTGVPFSRTPLNGGTYAPARGGTAIQSAAQFIWGALTST